MATSDPRLRPRRPRQIFAGVGVAALLLLAGCGVDTGDKAGVATDGGDGTTVPSTPPKPVTVDALKALLPEAKDVPDAYRTAAKGDDEDEGDDAGDEAMAENCPELAELTNTDDDDDDQVEVEFRTSDYRSLSAELTNDINGLDQDKAASLLTAIQGCEGYDFTDDDGSDVSVTIEGEATEGLGQYGLKLVADISFSADGEEVQVESTTFIVVRNGVGISTVATSGLRERDYSTIPADVDEAQQLAADLDAKVTEITE